MSKMTRLYVEMRETQGGPLIMTDTYAATGLTANSANKVPFPSPLNTVPRRVSLPPVGNGAVGAVVSLDTSQGAADPSGCFAGGKLGVDQNNLYVYIGNATQFQVTVEYCQYSGPFPQA